MIDLSQLPPPDVIEVPSVDVIREESLDWLAERDTQHADLDQRPSDPLYHAVELLAYRETLLRQKFNDDVRAMLLASSWGTNLDHLGVPEGVERHVTETETGEEVQELDDAYRQRIHLAKRARGAGVVEAYEEAAAAAHAQIGDVKAHSPDPAEVVVEWVPLPGVDSGLYVEMQAAIEEAVGRARVIGDRATVTQADLVSYSVEGTIYIAPGPDPATILAEALAQLAAYDTKERQVRHPRPLSALHAALTVPGVVKVELTEPTADVEPSGAECLEIDPAVFDEEAPTIVVEIAPWLV